MLPVRITEKIQSEIALVIYGFIFFILNISLKIKSDQLIPDLPISISLDFVYLIYFFSILNSSFIPPDTNMQSIGKFPSF